MKNSLEFFELIIGDDVYFWISSSIEIFFCLGIDLVTIELQSWDSEEGIRKDIASRTDDFPCLI